jgi:hypothetical protein
MTAYAKSIELGLTGTDAEIVAVLQTLAANDLPVSHVTEWLRVRRLWYLSPGGYAGPLQDVYDHTDVPQIKDALCEFFASVFGQGAEYIRATWPQYGPQIWAISGLISALIPGGETLQADLYAQFGGRPYADLTVEQFAAERSAAETPIVEPEWTDTAVLLSVNLSPQSQSVMLRMSRCAVVDGRVVNGPTVATLATAKAADDPRLESLLVEIRKLVEVC